LWPANQGSSQSASQTKDWGAVLQGVRLEYRGFNPNIQDLQISPLILGASITNALK